MKLAFIVLLFQGTKAISFEFQLAKDLVANMTNAQRWNTTQQLSKIFIDPVIMFNKVQNETDVYSMNELLGEYKKLGDIRFQSISPADLPTVLSMCYRKSKYNKIDKNYVEIVMKHSTNRKNVQTRIWAWRIAKKYYIERLYRLCEYGGTPDCSEERVVNEKYYCYYE